MLREKKKKKKREERGRRGIERICWSFGGRTRRALGIEVDTTGVCIKGVIERETSGKGFRARGGKKRVHSREGRVGRF